MAHHPLAIALLSAFFVSLVSLVGLATIPFHEQSLQSITFLLISLATGALFGDAIIHLMPEIFLGPARPLYSSLWMLGGILASFLFEKFLRWKQEHGLDGHHHEHGHAHPHAIKPVGRILLLSDGLHNFVDGLLIGASYLAGLQVGFSTTVAVILHEIPHEIGDFAVLLDAGWPRATALLFNFLSALIAMLGAGCAFLFQAGLHNFSQVALPITAGSFLYIAGTNLTPELHKESDPVKSLMQCLAIMAGIGLMLVLFVIE